MSDSGFYLFFGHAEIPFEDDVLPLGIADDALTVTPKLGVVRRQEDEPSKCPLAELLDEVPVAELRLHLPVGGDGAEIDHANMAAGRLRGLFLLGTGTHGHRAGV